jgi:hypothetical protein
VGRTLRLLAGWFGGAAKLYPPYETLNKIGSDAVLPVLEQSLADENEQVRTAVQAALTKIAV